MSRRYREFVDDLEDDRLDEAVRARPGRAEQTDEERYHDGNPLADDPSAVPPWLDLSNDREAEL